MTPEPSKTAQLLKAAIAALGIAFLVMSIACVWLGNQGRHAATPFVSVQKSLLRLEAKLDNVEQKVVAATKAWDLLNAVRQPNDVGSFGMGSKEKVPASRSESKTNAFGNSVKTEVSGVIPSAGVDPDSDAPPVTEFQNAAESRKLPIERIPSATTNQDTFNFRRLNYL